MGSRPKTLVIFDNDLEAGAIIRAVERKNAKDGVKVWDVIAREHPWGMVLSADDVAELLTGEPTEVVMVEVPNPGLEDRLRARGHQVVLVDHHLYIDGRGDRLDRRRNSSSLEQLAALYPDTFKLDSHDRMIAANDRGYWPALIAEALPERGPGIEQEQWNAQQAEAVEEAWSIRHEDLARRLDADEAAVKAEVCLAKAEIRKAISCWDQPPQNEQAVSLNILGCGRGNPEDPELIVARAPKAMAGVFLDALYRVSFKKVAAPACRFGKCSAESIARHPLEVLVLFQDEDGQTVEMDYSGPGHRRELLDQLLDQIHEEGGPLSRLRFWAGGTGRGCYLGADLGLASPSVLADLADRLANLLLEGNRPLARWASSFVQVLRVSDPRRKKLGLPIRRIRSDVLVPEHASKGERNYFHRHLREFLVPDEEEWRTADKIVPDDFKVRTYSSKWGRGNGSTGYSQKISVKSIYKGRVSTAWQREVPIRHARLHFAPGGLVLVEWMMHGGTAREPGPRLFDDLLLHRASQRFADEKRYLQGWPAAPFDTYTALPAMRAYDGSIDALADLLRLNHFGREAYGGYFSGGLVTLQLEIDGQTAGVVTNLRSGTQDHTDKPVGWFRAMLDHLLSDFDIGPDDLELVFDERSYVFSSAVGIGARPDLPEAQAKQDMLLGRFATVEDHGPQHFYHPPFAADELARAVYDRFASSQEYQDSEGRLAITDQSLVHWGYGWFARDIASKHVQSQYKRLYLVNVICNAVFHGLSQELALLYQKRKQAEIALAGSGRNGYGEMFAKPQIAYEREVARINVEMNAIKTRAVSFANALWFTDVSTQMQGREIYAKISEQMPTKAHYDELMDEFGRADAREAADSARMTERRRRIITLVTAALGAALPVSTLANEVFEIEPGPPLSLDSLLIMMGAAFIIVPFLLMRQLENLTLGQYVRTVLNAFRRLLP